MLNPVTLWSKARAASLWLQRSGGRPGRKEEPDLGRGEGAGLGEGVRLRKKNLCEHSYGPGPGWGHRVAGSHAGAGAAGCRPACSGGAGPQASVCPGVHLRCSACELAWP